MVQEQQGHPQRPARPAHQRQPHPARFSPATDRNFHQLSWVASVRERLQRERSARTGADQRRARPVFNAVREAGLSGDQLHFQLDPAGGVSLDVEGARG